MSENDVQLERDQDIGSVCTEPEEPCQYRASPDAVETDRRTWPLSRSSSVSLGESEAVFEYGVSPSLAGFLPDRQSELQGHTDGATPMVDMQPSSPMSAPDSSALGYLSDFQAFSTRDVQSASGRSRFTAKKPNITMKHAIAQGTVAPGQPSKVRRSYPASAYATLRHYTHVHWCSFAGQSTSFCKWSWMRPTPWRYA